jgi:hypothetical protein
MRLTTLDCGEHHVTVPQHGVLRIGTVASIVVDVAAHFGITKTDLVEKLFGESR